MSQEANNYRLSDRSIRVQKRRINFPDIAPTDIDAADGKG